MAEHLASIHGTEKDKVNCAFYFKIGACQYGEKCSRKHIRPSYSTTILMPNVFFAPTPSEIQKMSPLQVQEQFDVFYEDIFIECSVNYGKIEEMVICDNLGDHLRGNVYIRFDDEEQAARAVDALNKRFYQGRPLYAELSPATEFREARCRQHEQSVCSKGGYCNFMHPKLPSAQLKRDLFSAQRLMYNSRRRKN